MKNIEYNDPEDMAFKMEWTYHEIAQIVDTKNIVATTERYTLPPGYYETSYSNSMLRNLLPKEVKVNITIDDIRLKSNLNTNKTIRFTKRSFLYTILGFTPFFFGPLVDFDGLNNIRYI